MKFPKNHNTRLKCDKDFQVLFILLLTNPKYQVDLIEIKVKFLIESDHFKSKSEPSGLFFCLCVMAIIIKNKTTTMKALFEYTINFKARGSFKRNIQLSLLI